MKQPKIRKFFIAGLVATVGMLSAQTPAQPTQPAQPSSATSDTTVNPADTAKPSADTVKPADTVTPASNGTVQSTGATLVIGTGFAGGTYNKIGESLKILQSIKVQPSSGSIQNIKMLRDHQADLGLSQLDILVNFALRRKNIKDSIKIIIPIYREEVHLLARSDVESVTQLEDRMISIGPKSSGSYGTGRIILNSVGLDDNLSYLDFSDPNYALKEMNQKASVGLLIIVAGSPVELLKNQPDSFGKKYRLISFPEENYKSLTSEGLPYVMAEIPQGTYPWQKEAVQTLAVGSALICRSDLSEDTVEKLTTAILRNRDKLGQSHAKWKEVDPDAIKNFMAARRSMMHPGAIKAIENFK